MSVRVRRLGPEDIDAFTRLRREALETEALAFAASVDGAMTLDPDFLAGAFASEDQATYGAFDPGLVGSASVVPGAQPKEAHKAHVYGVYVTPACRGRGIGRRLMEAVIEDARARPGVATLHLSVSETSTAAVSLYERLGFVTWGIEPDALRADGRSVAQRHMILAVEEAMA